MDSDHAVRRTGDHHSSFTISEIKNNKKSWQTSIFGSLAGKDRDDGSGNDDSNKEKLIELRPIYKPYGSSWIISLMRWTFITSFTRLIFLFLVIYTVLCIGFAVFITIGHFIYEDCVLNSKNERTEEFTSALTLSWTTFSTVGYGSHYPTTNGGHCFFTHSVVSLEAFIGILYAGFCGAILFSKVLKIQREAPVEFSAGICLRYNSGDNTGSSSHGILSDCPRLEFRVVNYLGNVRGRGAVLDATIKCSMELSNHEDVEDDFEFWVDERQGENVVDGSVAEEASTYSFSSSRLLDVSSSRNIMPRRSRRRTNRFSTQLPLFYRCKLKNNRSSISTRTNVIRAVDKRNNTLIDLRKRFVNIKLDHAQHPCFARVWSFSHTLDENSPLLKPSVRKDIKNKVWPLKYRTCEKIEESLVNFRALLLNLSGICSDSEGEVSARKRYRFGDIKIGHRFAENVEIVSFGNGSRQVVVDFNKTNVLVKEDETHFGTSFDFDADEKCDE
mmetsp:Transcript_8165/g.10482  ORF Transcript_8165/g.10482 Transcript_8165/m.10482 type:complete len:500 (-) Transcript_8165:84-1583(-)|eukprot:CAMPEP_0116055502 /NCGR_PEP_ID=MMETSP0322-20121206/3446_1 /TAXON_ID=163516 /ORGANISM="Leptocylindrus danicus var. apora, Strain B651" /LENGTH=499 /DNA_ID=CAMNT_0003539119 /DNA_START=202 /DNA_END=1701 /DNA_ORIENTATION=+